MSGRCVYAAAMVLVTVMAGTAKAQPVLLPIHVAGSVAPADVDALVAAFCLAIGGEDMPLVPVSGAPCPHPERCIEAGLAAKNPHASYWLQLSGTNIELQALALRLDATGAVLARATVQGHPGQAAQLAPVLAAAVADGLASGLSVIADVTGAEVVLDGQAVGPTPLEMGPVDAGDHWVQVTSEGVAVLGLVPSQRGEATRLDLSFEGIPQRAWTAESPRSRPGAWPLLPILAGGTVAAILAVTDPAGLRGPDYTITIVPAAR